MDILDITRKLGLNKKQYESKPVLYNNEIVVCCCNLITDREYQFFNTISTIHNFNNRYKYNRETHDYIIIQKLIINNPNYISLEPIGYDYAWLIPNKETLRYGYISSGNWSIFLPEVQKFLKHEFAKRRLY